MYGPKIFLKAPKTLNEEKIKNLPLLMELRSKGVFIHIFEGIRTANLFFKVPNEYARGGVESLLISIISDVNSDLKLTLAQELLESFAKELINLKDAYRAFDINSKDYKVNPDKLKEIENLFFSFYKSIKPAIRTLEMAENRYQALFKAARDAIFIINRNLGIIIDVNKEAEKLVELNHEEIIGHQPSQLKIVGQEMSESKISEHLNEEKTRAVLKRFKTSNGKILFMEVSANEIQLGDQHLIQFIFHDITNIKMAEEKIKEHAKNIELLNRIITFANQTENLSVLLDNILDSIMEFLNLDGSCIYLIDKSTEMARIEAQKGIPRNFIESKNLLKINQNPYDFIFINGVAIFNKNFPEIVNKFLEGTDFKTTALIPLFSKFEIIGAINIVLKNKRNFSTEEIDLLISIGLEIGMTINKMNNELALKRMLLKYKNLEL